MSAGDVVELARHRFNHGTTTGYKRGCRCVDCTAANTAAAKRWREANRPNDNAVFTDAPGIQCRCGGRLVPCDGAFGDWMHRRTRSEFCPDGVVAIPVEKAWRGVGV